MCDIVALQMLHGEPVEQPPTGVKTCGEGGWGGVIQEVCCMYIILCLYVQCVPVTELTVSCFCGTSVTIFYVAVVYML